EGAIVARAVSQSNTNVWAKAGVMLRSSTDPGSPYYAAFITPSNGVAVQWRTALGGSSSQALTPGTAPLFLAVSIASGTGTAYTSADGKTWTAVPGSSVAVGLAAPYLAGLALTSHTWGTLGSATFDTVTISAVPWPWTDADVGGPTVAGSASYANGTFTVNGAGTDIYGTADQFHYVSQPWSGDGTLSARVASQANTGGWAKAGVMVRATSDPGSPYYALLATPANGLVVQWRTAQGATTGQVAVAGTVPAYLRVVRSAGKLSADTSPDGVTWTLVPGSVQSLALPTTALAGLAVTSHSGGVLGSATFDTVGLSSAVPNDFSLGATPPNPSVAQGASGTVTVATTVVSGAPETLALSVTGAPAGVSAAFSPTSVSTGSSSTLTLAVANAVAVGTYPLTVTATGPSATHSIPVTLNVTSSGLPSPWTQADIGSPAIAGSATYANGTFTVNGAGGDIYGTSDQFDLLSQPWSGDGTLSARVASQTNPSSWAKAGVMLRATSDPGSPYYAILVTPGNGIVVQWRTAQGATTGQAKLGGAVPVFLRVVRSGNTFSAGTSPDGVTWTLVSGAVQSIALPAGVLAGLAVTSHNTGALGTATFDSVGLASSVPNDFTASATPANPTIIQGASGPVTISTAVASGTPESLALSLSGAPAGVTGTFNPTSVSTGTSSTLTLTVASSVAAGTYAMTVTATGASATHSIPLSLTVAPVLPAPWADADVGSPSIAGSASYASGTFTVNGGGADIYGKTDQFHFVYQSMSGATTASADLLSQANTSSWAKAGLMLRATLDPGAPYFAVLATPGNGVVVQWRKTQGGGTTQVKVAGTVPVWLQVTYSGTSFSAATSPNGVTWTTVPGSTVTLSLPASYLAGLAVTSHNTKALCAAGFSNVAL
ncbi:MAG TPA: hypothetical protein VEY67_08185, partial [Candidatus Dormibacteraeota bacterium]|nr:hypothetical protein [Candidatus Dormibacteraeota bacterium]